MLSTVFLSVLAFGGPEVNDNFSIYCQAPGKKIIFVVTSDNLKKAPPWKSTEDNPPFPAGKAIKLATKLKESLVVDAADFPWTFEQASLKKTRFGGHWYWLVRFNRRSNDGFILKTVFQLEIPVLMDGTIPEPRINVDPEP